MRAGLSIDLDDLWSYQMIHGDPSWEDETSYLPTVVPLVLRFFADRGVTTTWFIVGRDAARAEGGDVLGPVAAAGHEIGNHSLNHEPWLHLSGAAAIRRDIITAHEAITVATGVVPRGFRGPGYTVSSEILAALMDAGYDYDASSLPTWIGPLARRYYFRSSDLTEDERALRSELFGRWRDGTRTLRPQVFTNGDRDLVEAPVTVMPGLRLPFHFSYLLYLSGRSERLASSYLAAALRICRLRRIEPALLLHPLDFLGASEVPELAFFPGMELRSEDKIARLHRYLSQIEASCDLVTMGDYVAGAGASARRRPVSAAP